MKVNKTVLKTIPILVASALALSACSAPAPEATAAKSNRVITIATSNDAPFAFTDSAGNLTGIDGEMWLEIGKCNGWDTKVFITDFATLIPSLTAKKADIIVDAMYITDKRKETINFTDPWYIQGEGVLVPAKSTVKTRGDLKGLKLGAQTGTVFADFIATLGGSETKFFDSQAALIAAVENGQVDAIVTDAAVLGYSLVQKPNNKIKLVLPYTPFFPGIIGAGTRKEDTELLAGVNKCLGELKASGKYLEILKKYGLGEDNVSK